MGDPERGGFHLTEMKRGGEWAKDRWFGKLGTLQYQAPDYTGSLDSAMSLIPEGWGFMVGDYFVDFEERPPMISEVYDLARVRADDCSDDEIMKAWAETKPLALVAAALRARAAL